MKGYPLDYSHLKLSDSVLDRFLHKIGFDLESGCWPWLASLDHSRYGRFGVGGQNVSASRLMHFMCTGDSNPNLRVCHTCDNPSCVNPDHLFLGTQLENIQDCKRKGRIYDRSGEKNPKAKLDRRHAEAIRILYSETGRTQKEIARLFGVKSTTVAFITQGRTWG